MDVEDAVVWWTCIFTKHPKVLIGHFLIDFAFASINNEADFLKQNVVLVVVLFLESWQE